MNTFDILDTEQINECSQDIDQISTLECLKIINQEDQKVASAVKERLVEIAEFIDNVYIRMKQGGRLYYIGAGTSGRLGVLDASECPPTYGVNKELIQGILAGGYSALTNAVEACEDDEKQAVRDLQRVGFGKQDCLLGIAASGRTPYVIAAIKYGNAIGAYCGALSCSRRAEISKYANTAIEIYTGAEVINGSTRMKAGTAQKMVLNMISTSLMISLGKVYKNYMVDVMPTNNKLIERAKWMICAICNCDKARATRLYEESHHNVKVAITMAKLGLPYEEAIKKLKKQPRLCKILTQ